MATLTSKLLGKSASTDAGLDDIFKASAGSSTANVVPQVQKKSKSKRSSDALDSAPEPSTKRPKKSKLITVDSPAPSLSKSKSKAEVAPKKDKGKAKEDISDGSSASGDDGIEKEYKRPAHVSATGEDTKKKKKAPKVKYTPSGETKEQVDARTVFVGNLPSSVLKKSTSSKALIRHLTSFLPEGTKFKVDSTRFRSIPFSMSTEAKVVEDEPRPKPVVEEGEVGPKTYLTANQKKRIAFLKGEINDKADVVTCYVVFGHHPPPPEGQEEANQPTHPAEVARLVVSAADSTVFMERTIRVDRVGVKDAGAKRDDMKRTVFVGSLDFEAKEEDLRVFFETLLTEERGESEGADDLEEGKTGRWVQVVRIVRDPDTQLGKGIAYIQFKDVECVDEVLALSEDRLKFAKRKLRLQRCKTLARSGPSDSKTKVVKEKPSSSPRKAGRTPSRQPLPNVPAGDPTLGTRLSGLPKDARKEAKAGDADRVARRLAKKKARAALDRSLPSQKGGILGKMPKSKSSKGAVKKPKKVKK